MAIIDGKAIATLVLEELKGEVASLPIKPSVLFIRVGEDPASVSYVSKKQKTATETGIESKLDVLPESTTEEELLKIVDAANRDTSIHGILVQAPLPSHISERTIFNAVHPDKDVDGFNRVNIGRLCQEDPSAFESCTPAGIIELLKRSNITTSGKRVAVVGRSLIVGKPTALLLSRKGEPGNATVTLCHSMTKNLPAILKQSQIIIAAIGKPHFITEDMVADGTIIIDVGVNRVEDPTRKSGYRLVGDVDYEKVAPKCEAITPVPGGVGPMTVAMLMKNTAKACRSYLESKNNK